MAQSEDMKTLVQLSLLRHMPNESKGHVADLLVAISARVMCSDGDTLINEQSLGGREGFILLRGYVTIRKEGAEPIVLGSPALLGEMLQFNPRALRTATVCTKGETTVLKFSWQDFYLQSKQRLTEAEQALLMEGIERSVWERFGRDAIIDLALFRGIPDRLKLRACLVLQWIVRPEDRADGEQLFAQGDLCGGTGYALVKGAVRLLQRNYPARTLTAPDVLGVMSRFDPDLQWSATASATGVVELLKFSWQEYLALLQRHLSPQEFDQFMTAIDANASTNFIH